MVRPFLTECLAHPRNAEVAHEVATATEMGLPLSVARGAREPGSAWTPRDWALAQAAKKLDRARCPGCGTPLWLAFDPALEFRWRAGLPHRCHPCTAIEVRTEEYYRDAPQPSALRFGVELV